MKSNVSILVSSFDGYSDLWKPLEKSYSKYWSDCPYDIYISTNFINEGFTKFKPIPTGKDKTWSDMLIKTLANIETKYILLTFDDLFLYKKINSQDVKMHIKNAEDIDANYYQLYPSISGKVKVDTNFSKKKKNSKYRNGTVWSLWKKEVLLDLLNIEENAWQFEINGNLRSNSYDNFFTANNVVIPYLNGVVKGVWVRDILSRLKKDEIILDSSNRKKMNFLFFCLYKFKLNIFNLYRRII